MSNHIGPPPFWLVWRAGGEAPTKRHEDAYFAEKEATRLAQKSPGETFFVLAPIASVTCGKLEIERFDASDEIPF